MIDWGRLIETQVVMWIGFLVGCGTYIPNPYSAARLEIDPILFSYVYELEEKYGINVDDVGVTFFSSPHVFTEKQYENAAGVCYSSRAVGGHNMIAINDRWWYNVASECDKLMLLIHEFGHCNYGLDHVDDINHIMYPTVVLGCTEEDLKIAAEQIKEGL